MLKTITQLNRLIILLLSALVLTGFRTTTHKEMRTFSSIEQFSLKSITQMTIETMQLMGYQLKDWNDSTGYVYGSRSLVSKRRRFAVNVITGYQGQKFLQAQCFTDSDLFGVGNRQEVQEFFRLFNKVATRLSKEAGKDKSLAIKPSTPHSDSPTSISRYKANGSTVKSMGKRWAVVIGVSEYSDSRIPSLRYASNDANSFYKWLISPNGGGYSLSRVKLLINKDATGRNIKEALFDWLAQALEEDLVTIYFAGHGTPQSPDKVHNLFLLPYDAQYNKISATGFPMWDIETALKRFIKAKKVVVIADACHAGGVGNSFDIARRANRGIGVNPINSGIQNLSRIGDGICVISASDDKQLSQESKNWGGGHGVFTYFLLEGLQGNADYNKDTNVTLGELVPYLSEQVRRATRSAQSPMVAGKFDPALTIAK
jgi:uncharacterized caspase-like protein